jgi:succinoglycan biosynthesis transport protein ExoP
MERSNLPMFPTAQPLTVTSAAIPLNYIHPGLTLAQIRLILVAYWRVSLMIAVAVVAATCVLVKVMPRTYAATATLMVDYQINDPLAHDEFPIGLLSSYMSTQIELMRSPEVLNQVIDELHLAQNRNYTSGFAGDRVTLNDWIQKQLLKNLTVEQGRFGSQLIYVSYDSHDPNESARIANAVVGIYTRQQFQRQNGPASERAKRYDEQLQELKSNVSRAQDKVTQFRQSNNLVSSDVHVDVDMQLLSSLEQRLLDAQNAERAAEVKAGANHATSSDALSSPVIQGLKGQLATQEAHLAELRGSLGPRHPQVQQQEAQIDITRRAIAAEVQNYAGSASSDLSSSRQLVGKMQRAVDEQQHRVLGLLKLQDEAAKYTLELESAQAVYKRALDNYDQIMVASNSHYSNVRMVSEAVPPLRANKPKPIKLLLLGCVFAVFAGLCGPFAYELFNRRVRCQHDLERELGIPVLVEYDIGPAQGSLP